MKNIKLMPVAFMLLFVFGACNNGQNQKEKEDNKETSVATKSFDLAYWELQGPVKTLSFPEMDANNEVRFDRNGQMTEMGGYNPFAVEDPSRELDENGEIVDYFQWTRDDQGYISSIVGFDGTTEYTWNDGKLVREESFEEGYGYLTEYEYDAEGRLAKQTMYEIDVEEEGAEPTLTNTTEFVYLEFDSQGNWTRRKVKTTDATIGYVNEVESKRVIEYYE